MTNDRLVQNQFSKQAQEYALSPVHAKGRSLERLQTIVPLQPGWSVLDVGSGTGHTAFSMAATAARVVALDLTLEMLICGRDDAEDHFADRISWCQGEAHNLPFKKDSFNLITCRLAAHHFYDIEEFMASAISLLVPCGHLAIVDNIVPGPGVTRKNMRESQDAGGYINAFERLRDPSHQRCLSIEEWQEAFYSRGLRLWHTEIINKQLDFDSWVSRMAVAEDDVVRLKVMLLQAPGQVRDFLMPGITSGKLTFQLQEVLLVGVRDN